MHALKLAAIAHEDLCHGWQWTVVDEDALAAQVARVALGQYRHVARILAGRPGLPLKTRSDQILSAIKMLTLKENEDPWHRDGWLFQTISWIAAHQVSHGSVTRPPHIIKAHKGFDGIQLEFSPDGKKVLAVVIFEDKATSKARKTITRDVWPGIKSLERGERIGELTHETTALLESQRNIDQSINIDDAINTLIWKDVRKYRVSITVDDTYSNKAAREKLFKGFDLQAPGKIGRRQANTMLLPSLRPWMDAFAMKVICHLEESSSDV